MNDHRSSQNPDDDRIRDAKQAVDRDNLILGRELYIAFSTRQYKTDGFASFDQYAISVGVDPWRAKRLRRIFKKFSKDIGVSFEQMLRVGHEKLKAIEPVVNRGNKGLWLGKAAELDYTDLVTLVNKHKPPKKKRRTVKKVTGKRAERYSPEDAVKLIATITDDRMKPSSDGTSVTSDDTVHVRTLYLIGDQNTVFDTTIDNMERRTGSTKVGYLLTSALEEFLAHEATRGISDDKRREYFMGILERRYQGKLLWVKDKKVANKLAELILRAEEDA